MEKHGQGGGGAYRQPLYRAWLGMRNRCNNPRTPDFRYYGGRGVRVCPQWDSFTQFAADVGPHPGSRWTLDRRDNNKDYEPSNVRWATRQTQVRNRNYCILDEAAAARIRKMYASGGYRQIDLAKVFGCSQVTISQVVRGVTW